VLDLLMPEMDGTDLVEILRSYLRLRALPIIVVTAAPDSPQAYKARRQKVKAILQKARATFEDIHEVITAELRAAV
jgi:CheY-like chemotaxis protein